MAYADFDFYKNSYYGDVLTSTNAPKWLDRASDALDTLTFGRLPFAFPTIDAHIIRVKKAVCAVAETLYSIDVQRKALSYRETANGEYKGVVSSISSGRETVSYSTGNAGGASVYAKAAANAAESDKLIANVASAYIANIPDAEGVNLLYAGEV